MVLPKGTYCLILKTDGCRQVVGSLGELEFRAGYYIYAGSALGPGGLQRLHRHMSLSMGKKPRWHIDYLLLSPHFELAGAVYVESEEKIECAVAGRLGQGVPGFGCSDCSCSSHLFYREDWPEEEIRGIFGEMGFIARVYCDKK
jgi:Uri superfamily endonuclease